MQEGGGRMGSVVVPVFIEIFAYVTVKVGHTPSLGILFFPCILGCGLPVCYLYSHLSDNPL